MIPKKKRAISSDLRTLMNVGQATYQDFLSLGITSIVELARAQPDELYLRLQKITGVVQDPCVWDIFAATIHEARTGEKQPWWYWTPVRKKRQKSGTFV